MGLLVATGCGSGSGPIGEDVEAPGEGRYELVITFWPEGRDGRSSTATLTCDPTGGTHPHPVKACTTLDAHPEALHPVPTDVACTEIYGGDQAAEVKGTGPDRAPVNAVLKRTNGCEIARWDALAPVLEITD